MKWKPAKLPSYRNQSVDLRRYSIDKFLYDGNFGVQRVKKKYLQLALFKK